MDDLVDRFAVTWREPVTVAQDYRTTAGVVRWSLTVTHSTGPIAFELLEGGPGTVWETDAVTRLHHYAFWSTDLAGEVAALVRRGWRLELSVAGAGDGPAGFAYLVRDGSARLELIARTAGDRDPPADEGPGGHGLGSETVTTQTDG